MEYFLNIKDLSNALEGEGVRPNDIFLLRMVEDEQKDNCFH